MSYLVGTMGENPLDMLKDTVTAEMSKGIDAASAEAKNLIDPGAKQREQDRINAENEQKKREQAAATKRLLDSATSGMPSLLGVPLPVLLIGGAAAAFFLMRK